MMPARYCVLELIYFCQHIFYCIRGYTIEGAAVAETKRRLIGSPGACVAMLPDPNDTAAQAILD
jgi:hypothetical protein